MAVRQEMVLLEVTVLFFVRWELKHIVSMMMTLTRLAIRIIIEKSKQISAAPHRPTFKDLGRN